MSHLHGRAMRSVGCCLLLLAILGPGSGCSTSMTSMTNARAYEPLEVQAAVNYQVNAHSNIASAGLQGARTAAEEFGQGNEEPISEEAYRDWLDLALTAALFRPATGPEILARVGVTDKLMYGLDVGVRTNLKLVKGDVKLQFWESRDQTQAMSFMVGYAHHLDVVSGALSYVTLTDFARSDFDFQALWGWEVGDILRVNVAPHIILSRITAEQKLPDYILERLPEEVLQYDPNQLFQNEWLAYYGANTSLMIGYKYAFVAIDTGFFWMNFKPTVLGQERDFGGGAISLAGGLSLHYAF